MVDARGLHSFVYKKGSGKTTRHHSLHDLIDRSFSAAGVPVVKEPIQVYLVPTGNVLMDFPSFPGKTARRFAGM